MLKTHMKIKNKKDYLKNGPPNRQQRLKFRSCFGNKIIANIHFLKNVLKQLLFLEIVSVTKINNKLFVGI